MDRNRQWKMACCSVRRPRFESCHNEPGGCAWIVVRRAAAAGVHARVPVGVQASGPVDRAAIADGLAGAQSRLVRVRLRSRFRPPSKSNSRPQIAQLSACDADACSRWGWDRDWSCGVGRRTRSPVPGTETGRGDRGTDAQNRCRLAPTWRGLTRIWLVVRQAHHERMSSQLTRSS